MPLLIALVAAAALVLTASPAQACMNGVIMEQSEVVKNLRLAEKALKKGKPKQVFRLLKADHYIGGNKLLKRVRLIKAVAHLRMGKTKKAERVFRSQLRRDKDNPFLQTRLAEALHKRRGEDPIEAWKIMDDLEKRDLIPDARGYAVLAHLRGRSKDAKGQQRALDMCRAIAGSQSKVC